MEFRQAVAETGPFGRRCLSILPCSPFPLPAHQTGRADFPHPAFRSGFNVTPSAEPSSHIQTGLAVPHAILVARPLANRRAFQPFHRRPESEAPSLHGRYPFLCYYGPLRHPIPPGLALTGFRLSSRPRHQCCGVSNSLTTPGVACTLALLCPHSSSGQSRALLKLRWWFDSTWGRNKGSNFTIHQQLVELMAKDDFCSKGDAVWPFRQAAKIAPRRGARLPSGVKEDKDGAWAHGLGGKPPSNLPYELCRNRPPPS